MTLIKNPKTRRVVIALNVLFWLSFISLISYGIWFSDDKGRSLGIIFLQGSLGISLIIVPVVYFNALVLIPRFLVPKKYWKYILGVLLLITVWPVGPIYLVGLLERDYLNVPPEDLDEPFHPAVFLVMFAVICISTVVNMAYRWLLQQGEVEKIENERLLMELSLLKNQISPHFFFNTLNNLYALALEESKETPKVILKLSEMMRYTIYDCNTTHVPLTSEINYLENYIGLQQIRYHHKVDISFERRVLHDETQICPLILIVFVENAFKHGVDGSGNEAFVKIDLSAYVDHIQFSIHNKIGEPSKEVGGIGLENVRKRLDLIYGEDYQLTTGEREGVYSVDLRIKLN